MSESKRRPKGSGSVTRVGDRYRWRAAGLTGYTDTHAQAAKRARRAIELAKSDGPLTVADYIRAWRRKRTTKHKANESNYLDNYVLSHQRFETIPLKKLTRSDCMTWLRKLETRRSSRSGELLSKHTIRNAKNLLRRALQDATDRGLIKGNPLDGLRSTGGRKGRPHDWLRPHEIDAVLALDLDIKQRSIIMTAIYTGLSPMELWALRWDHVDTTARIIRVRGDLKTDSRARDVPLIRGTAEALEAWREDQQRREDVRVAHALAKGRPRKRITSPLVWPGCTGRMLGKSADPARWREKRQSKVGVPYVRPSIPQQAGLGRHIVFRDLRHTFASNLISGSWGPALSLLEVADLMGHSDVSATKIYAHLHPEGPLRKLLAMDAAHKKGPR